MLIIKVFDSIIIFISVRKQNIFTVNCIESVNFVHHPI